MEPFSRTFHARWGDMDFNGHMRNTAFLDVSGDVRMMFFQEHGFTMRQFEALRIGPVILRDELDYRHELRLLEPFRVTLQLAGLSADLVRFRMRNEFHGPQDRLAARVTSTGGWLDLVARRLTPPPAELRAVIELLPRTPDFEELPARPPRPASP